MPMTGGQMGDSTAQAAAVAAQAAVDAVEVKTDHITIVGGDLAFDTDLVPVASGTQRLGIAGAAWGASVVQEVNPA